MLLVPGSLLGAETNQLVIVIAQLFEGFGQFVGFGVIIPSRQGAGAVTDGLEGNRGLRRWRRGRRNGLAPEADVAGDQGNHYGCSQANKERNSPKHRRI